MTNRCSVCIHQMNRVTSRSDHGHEDSTINVVIDYYYYMNHIYISLHGRQLANASVSLGQHYIRFNGCFPHEPKSVSLHDLLPPLIIEENLWGLVARVSYRPDVLSVSQPTTSKHCFLCQSTDHNQASGLI